MMELFATGPTSRCARPRGVTPALVLLLVLASAATSVLARPGASAAALPGPIESAFRRAGVPPSAVSLYVREAGATEPWTAHRAQVPMNPASTMKILTTAMALDVLGKDYTWATEALAGGPIRDGTLHGPLVLRGSGDPSFTWEHLRDLVTALRAGGLHTLAGDVFVDRQRFGPIRDTTERFDG